MDRCQFEALGDCFKYSLMGHKEEVPSCTRPEICPGYVPTKVEYAWPWDEPLLVASSRPEGDKEGK